MSDTISCFSSSRRFCIFSISKINSVSVIRFETEDFLKFIQKRKQNTRLLIFDFKTGFHRPGMVVQKANDRGRSRDFVGFRFEFFTSGLKTHERNQYRR